MADPVYQYPMVYVSAFNKEIDFEADTIKGALIESTYTPSNTHQYFDVSVSSHEASGTGYSAGGVTLTGKSSSVTGDTFALDAGDASLPGNEAAGRYFVVYDDTPASNKPVIARAHFPEDKVPTSVSFHPNGLCTVTVATP